MSEESQLDQVFRREYGLLVASLVSRVGIESLDKVEDAVQWAIMQAIIHWSKGKEPSNHVAWLYKVAFRSLMSELKTSKRHQQFESQLDVQPDDKRDIPFSNELNDSMLRMLLIASDESIPIESQLVFILKSLCGFNTNEIAQRLFISEANVYKRYGRAQSALKNLPNLIESLSDSIIVKRMPSVHRILYLVFTEGYLSSHTDVAIRKDLCEEAMRLAQTLLLSKQGKSPESYALVALMLFNLARISSRENEFGLVLLEHQNRNDWDKQQIAMAFGFLQKSAYGEELSRYHIEAGIAAEHCLAPSFEQTRWDKIAQSYELLERISPSPIHMLNRAVAVAQWKGAATALDILESADMPSWLSRSYHWFAVLADLQIRCGYTTAAKINREQALKLAPSKHIQQLLKERLVNQV